MYYKDGYFLILLCYWFFLQASRTICSIELISSCLHVSISPGGFIILHGLGKQAVFWRQQLTEIMTLFIGVVISRCWKTSLYCNILFLLAYLIQNITKIYFTKVLYTASTGSALCKIYTKVSIYNNTWRAQLLNNCATSCRLTQFWSA